MLINSLMRHFFTLKHLNNCGIQKDQLIINARAYLIIQGGELLCSTVSLTNVIEIAEREYNLGLLEKNREPK